MQTRRPERRRPRGCDRAVWGLRVAHQVPEERTPPRCGRGDGDKVTNRASALPPSAAPPPPRPGCRAPAAAPALAPRGSVCQSWAPPRPDAESAGLKTWL